MSTNPNTKIIGVGGYARSGKDTFVNIASKILKENGYIPYKQSFATGLKDDLDDWLKEKYGISAWTENNEEKMLIRPFLIAHGCAKRKQTEGKYWVDKVDENIDRKIIDDALERVNLSKVVFLISDVRFPNEVNWLHQREGWFVHLRRYLVSRGYFEDTSPDGNFDSGIREIKTYDAAPNEEEAYNDPICRENADYNLELENVSNRELRLLGNKITPSTLIDNTYLNEEIKLCLTKCPFLTIQ